MSASPSADLAPIALTMGDPSGIGPEIIVKLASDLGRPATDLVVIGDVGVLRRAAAGLGAGLAIAQVSHAAAAVGRNSATLCVLQAGDACVGVTHGVVTKAIVARFVAGQ